MMDYTIFGESHGPAVGVLLRDVPPGLPVDEEFICRQLLRRAPQDPLSTARHEPDQVEVLSGVYQGVTTGMPVCLLLRNRDVRSADYDALRHTPRPSHADYTAWVQSGGRNDPRGGGAFSGRLTAPLVAAGALAKGWLNLQDIEVNAQVIDENALRQRAEEARQEGDSVGGQVRCIVTGLPAGWGGPDWRETVESEIARHVFAIPGVKAVAFGAGEEFAALRGSQANDPWRTDGRRVWSVTNHSGGINGGVGSSSGTSVTKISPVAGGIAGILGLGGAVASVAIPVAGAVIGPLLGTAGRAIGGMAPSRTAFNSIARNIGGSMGVNTSWGTSHSATEQTGTSHSTSDGTSHGTSDTISQQESHGTTDARGMGRTQQVELL